MSGASVSASVLCALTPTPPLASRMQAGGLHLRLSGSYAGVRRHMTDRDERHIAHPGALALWLAFLACLALAVVLLPIFAVP